MNRRHVLIAMAASGLNGLNVSSVQANTERKVICRKRLGPMATVLHFTAQELSTSTSLNLVPSGNALWINSMRWQDENANWHHENIRRNLAPDRTFPLHIASGVRHLSFSITTLPFTNSSTDVSLLA